MVYNLGVLLQVLMEEESEQGESRVACQVFGCHLAPSNSQPYVTVVAAQSSDGQLRFIWQVVGRTCGIAIASHERPRRAAQLGGTIIG